MRFPGFSKIWVFEFVLYRYTAEEATRTTSVGLYKLNPLTRSFKGARFQPFSL
jgi:hypothetical protein